MTAFWTMSFPLPGTGARSALRAEQQGWDGILFTDSQNFNGDCYVALGAAAEVTDSLGLGTGVTNPHTRNPAVTACAAASVQVASGGRMVLGIGRGDSALGNLGLDPVPVAVLEQYVVELQRYLSGGEVEQNGTAKPIRWLAEEWYDAPKVPVDISATGPRVTELAGRHADVITLAVGANVERLGKSVNLARQARSDAGLDPDSLQVGAYLNIAAHPDVDLARQVVLGSVGTFTHFSAMKDSPTGSIEQDREVFEAVGDAYELAKHGDAGASHLDHLTPEFIDRFGIVGTPEDCAARLADLLDAVPLDRVVVASGSRGVDPKLMGEVATVTLDDVINPVRRR